MHLSTVYLCIFIWENYVNLVHNNVIDLIMGGGGGRERNYGLFFNSRCRSLFQSAPVINNSNIIEHHHTQLGSAKNACHFRVTLI